MLCYVMLCYVMLCSVLVWYAMLCCVVLCYVFCCVVLCYIILCVVLLCYAISLSLSRVHKALSDAKARSLSSAMAVVSEGELHKELNLRML